MRLCVNFIHQYNYIYAMQCYIYELLNLKKSTSCDAGIYFFSSFRRCSREGVRGGGVTAPSTLGFGVP